MNTRLGLFYEDGRSWFYRQVRHTEKKITTARLKQWALLQTSYADLDDDWKTPTASEQEYFFLGALCAFEEWRKDKTYA